MARGPAQRLAASDALFDLWPENLPALEIFRALKTQWRLVAGFGGVTYQGLRYAEARAEIRERRVKDRAGMLADLRVMERAALPILNGLDDDGGSN